MSARDLVVRPGDRVSLAGRYVRAKGEDWLNLARASTLAPDVADCRPRNSVRVIALDPNLVPQDFGPDNNLLRGWALVTGVWQDDTITADSQSSVERPKPTPRPALAAHRPPDGWDATTRSKHVPVLDTLRQSGAIVMDEWMHDEDSGALILRVAAADVDLVRDALKPHLARRTWIVASRYTSGDLRRVAAGFGSHAQRWGFEMWTPATLTYEGQPAANATLVRVGQDLADWADTLPAGLLRLEPTITPAQEMPNRHPLTT